MKERKTWEEFKKTGLLWFINMILHAFGWAIFLIRDDNEDIIDAFPATTTFRGFEEESNTRGYRAVTNYLAENVDTLLEDVKEEDDHWPYGEEEKSNNVISGDITVKQLGSVSDFEDLFLKNWNPKEIYNALVMKCYGLDMEKMLRYIAAKAIELEESKSIIGHFVSIEVPEDTRKALLGEDYISKNENISKFIDWFESEMLPSFDDKYRLYYLHIKRYHSDMGFISPEA